MSLAWSPWQCPCKLWPQLVSLSCSPRCSSIFFLTEGEPLYWRKHLGTGPKAAHYEFIGCVKVRKIHYEAFLVYFFVVMSQLEDPVGSPTSLTFLCTTWTIGPNCKNSQLGSLPARQESQWRGEGRLFPIMVREEAPNLVCYMSSNFLFLLFDGALNERKDIHIKAWDYLPSLGHQDFHQTASETPGLLGSLLFSRGSEPLVSLRGLSLRGRLGPSGGRIVNIHTEATLQSSVC